MWVKTRKQLVNLDQCRTVLIDSFYRKNEQPLYTLIAVVSGANEGRVELESYSTTEDAVEAYAYLHQCLALGATLCDLPTKGAVKL